MVWRCACGLDIILALIFVTFSTLGTLSFSDLRFYENVVTVGTLWAQLLIQFYTNLSETLHMFSPRSGDVHIIWIIIIQDLIFVTFSTLWTLSFSERRFYENLESCGRNSSYNFIAVLMKLCTCFCHGLEMCVWFGYNPWINFCHFFHFVYFVIFWPQILWKCVDSGYLVSATPYTISCLSLCNFAHLFFHGLKMCMWFGFNPAVNFCHFIHFVSFHRCDINFTEIRSILFNLAKLLNEATFS